MANAVRGDNEERARSTDRFATPRLSEVKLQPIAVELDTQLHSSDQEAQDDVALLEVVVAKYRQGFGSNPVGLNQEIVATLAGRNSENVALISPEHPSIDEKGQLLDRWGTPYFFHQQSGDDMEIVSAGPDRQLFTVDDIKSATVTKIKW